MPPADTSGLFSRHIGAIRAFYDDVRASGRRVREWQVGVEPRDPLFTPAPPGPGTTLVMRSETFVELGGPTVESCAFAMIAGEDARVRDGRVRLVGPDIPEATAGEILPFGQVVVAEGETLGEAALSELAEAQRLGGRIGGFMVKSTPGHVWCRVGVGLAGQGFGFADLGAALVGLIKHAVWGVEAAEVLFVTSSGEDVARLALIGEAVDEISRAVKARRWKERGIDISECAFGGHCGSCAEKNVCDNVKKLAHMRRLARMEADRP